MLFSAFPPQAVHCQAVEANWLYGRASVFSVKGAISTFCSKQMEKNMTRNIVLVTWLDDSKPYEALTKLKGEDPDRINQAAVVYR